MVLLTVDDQQRTAVRVLRVHLRLRPRVEVGVAHLRERQTRTGDVAGVVELPSLLLVERIRPAVLELVEGQRDRAATRAGVDQEWADALEHLEWQWQYTAEDTGVDRDGGRRHTPPCEHLRQQAPSGMPDQHRLLVQRLDHLGRVIGDLLE